MGFVENNHRALKVGFLLMALWAFFLPHGLAETYDVALLADTNTETNDNAPASEEKDDQGSKSKATGEIVPPKSQRELTGTNMACEG